MADAGLPMVRRTLNSLWNRTPNPASKTFQEALFKQGIPLTAFEVDDIQAEYERLKGLDVMFTMAPTPTGPVTVAIFADTCGNLIQIYQPKTGKA